MTRRGFLRATRRVAVAAAVSSQARWITGCSDAGGPSEAAWRDLASRLDGYVLRPGDPAFYDTALPHNLRYADILPQGIAMCAGTTDVQTSILWSREHDLGLVARAGSHSYAGFSTTSGLMINVTPMSGVAVDPSRGTVTADAGAHNREVSAALGPYAVAIPQGRCPPVGIAGLTLGGGFGFSSRNFGLTSDHLVETTVVTASGEILVCNERDQADLFWACRGGGGGNFGINTSFTYDVVPVGDVSVFRLEWQGTDDATAVLEAFSELMASAPDAFSLRLGFSAPRPSSRSDGIKTTALGQLFGPSSELMEILEPVFQAAMPTKKTIEDLSFYEAHAFLAAEGPPNYFIERSSFAVAPLSGNAIATIVDELMRWPGSSEVGYLTMFSWGGAINRVAPDATAFVHREGQFLMAVGTEWDADDPQGVIDADLAWANEFWEALQPDVLPFSYQNFTDRALTDWPRAYYGANLERLTQVKAAVDPDDVFRFAQSIPVG